MIARSYFGMRCADCGSTVDIAGEVVDTKNDPACFSCGGRLVPNAEARPVLANAQCSRCGAKFGMSNSDKCLCGGSLVT